jgi:hypothetical protein
MLIRYQDLVSLNLVATDGTKHRIEDVYIEDRGLRLAYVVVDLGGWFDDRKAMVSIDRFGEPDVSKSEWPCTLDEAALEERPEPRPEEAGTKSLPDALMIPVGSRVSPRLLHRSIGDSDLPIAAKADPKGRIPEGAHLRSVGEWIVDTDVEATDGKAGKLMGVIFDQSDWTTHYIVVEQGGDGLPENQRVLQARRITGTDFEHRRVRLDMTVDEVHKALDLHEIDDLDSKWYNRVLAYYGLQS